MTSDYKDTIEIVVRVGNSHYKMELAWLSFLDRMFSKAMKAQDEDRCDWGAIRAWAETLIAG